LLPIIDIIAELHRFSLFHMDYKRFYVNNLLLSLVRSAYTNVYISL